MSDNGPTHRGQPDEAVLLAWVEGEHLSADARAAVTRAMLADPGLARLLELMRSDRAALCSLPELPAPDGLLESVESALEPLLERELLLGLQDGEPAESHPVVSMVRPEKRGVFQTFLADRAGRRMALAASLLLLIGGATWWAAVSFSGGTRPGPIGPIADKGGGPEPAESAAGTTSAMSDAVGIEEGTRLAKSDEGIHPPALKSTDEIEAPSIPEVPIVTALVDEVGPVRPEVDASLAAELARERKLVIRVVSHEARVSPRRVCDRVRKECNASGWKLAGHVPQEVAAALDVRPLEVPTPAPRVISPEPPAFAGPEAMTPLVGPPAPVDVPFIEESEPQPVYIVQARLDAATLSQLKASLERSGRGDEVVFQERYEPLPAASGPVLSPQAILWWTNPPSGWTSWGEVPVVIEPR